MAKKNDKEKRRENEKNYFKQLSKTASMAVDLSELMEKNVKKLPINQEQAAAMHKIEHEADGKHTDLIKTLYKEFIPPIERANLMALVYSLDDVIDAIEDVGIRIFMLRITDMQPEALEVIKVICKMSKVLEKAFSDLHNFKKPKFLYTCIDELKELEEKGDEIYRRAVRKLFDNAEETVQSSMEIIKWREIYEMMEQCCTAFEKTSNAIQDTIMENS